MYTLNKSTMCCKINTTICHKLSTIHVCELNLQTLQRQKERVALKNKNIELKLPLHSKNELPQEKSTINDEPCPTLATYFENKLQ